LSRKNTFVAYPWRRPPPPTLFLRIAYNMRVIFNNASYRPPIIRCLWSTVLDVSMWLAKSMTSVESAFCMFVARRTPRAEQSSRVVRPFGRRWLRASTDSERLFRGKRTAAMSDKIYMRACARVWKSNRSKSNAGRKNVRFVSVCNANAGSTIIVPFYNSRVIMKRLRETCVARRRRRSLFQISNA